MTIRFATREDVAAWFGGKVPSTMRVMVLEEGGKVCAIAGIAQGDAGLQVFSDIAADRPSPMALGRLAVKFGRLMDAIGGPMFALCNEQEPTSPGLLAHMGFERNGAMWERG